ncbi:YggU family protein [Candidatus Woesearchaeota archaeon]|nr:YggU family protein [Candidatus Woesearchaeota archaeon]
MKVRPGARKDRIVSFEGDVLSVEVAAPADKGKANRALVKFLSKELGCQVRVKSGFSGREKLLVFV